MDLVKIWRISVSCGELSPNVSAASDSDPVDKLVVGDILDELMIAEVLQEMAVVDHLASNTVLSHRLGFPARIAQQMSWGPSTSWRPAPCKGEEICLRF